MVQTADLGPLQSQHSPRQRRPLARLVPRPHRGHRQARPRQVHFHVRALALQEQRGQADRADSVREGLQRTQSLWSVVADAQVKHRLADE